MDNENYKYQAPGPNDSRGPCPALNMLTNHGYLPRDGKDITANQFIEAIYKGLNLSKIVGFILAHSAFYSIGKTWKGKLSLEDLYNDSLLHPASLTRPDKDLGGDYKKISPELLDSLFSEKNKDNVLTRRSFAKQYIKRRDQSLRDNPKFHGLSFLQKYQTFGEHSLAILSFPGSEGNGRGEEIDVDTLRSICQFERLPDHWKRSEVTIGIFQVRSVSNDIQRIADDLDKENKDREE